MTTAKWLLVVFAIVIGTASASAFLAPQRLIRWVGAMWRRPISLYLAVGVRLLLGALLITAAPGSRFPMALAVIGWIAVVPAVTIPLLGRSRIDSLLTWFAKGPESVLRAWCVCGVVFGAFLIFGLWSEVRWRGEPSITGRSALHPIL